jgi:hypothetical protein
MAQERSPSRGPDLTRGVTLAEFFDGKLAGHVGDQEVLLVQSGTEIFAVAAHCSHYHGPLAEGLVVGDPEFWGEVQLPASLKGLDIPSRRAVFVPWKPSRRRGFGMGNPTFR